MKLFVLILFINICYLDASPLLNQCARKVVETGANLACKAVQCQLPKDTTKAAPLDVSEIVVYFYDFHNRLYKNFPIERAAKGILSVNNFKISNKLFMYVGGFKSHIKQPSMDQIRDAFKTINNSYLILIDHSAYTHNKDGCTKTNYERSVKYVPNIGKKLAEMLYNLMKRGFFGEIRCIGHSLGGQILGHVGENFKKLSHQNISRLTALDPAGPCFGKIEKHIRHGLADYVEIYHCNAGVLGSKEIYGDVDFFVNDGTIQPECGKTSSVNKCWESSKCSHKSCVAMWTASVLNKNWYPAYDCDKYKDLNKRKSCGKTTAGFWNPGTAKGKYYISTSGYNF